MTTLPRNPTAAAAPPVSLYEAIGGQPAIVAAVDVFYSKMLADPEVSHFFPEGVGPRHRAHIAAFIADALGGPQRYHGPDLGEAHRKHAIADADFDKTAGHLAAALSELGVPDDLVGQIIAIVATLRPVVVTA